MQPLSQPILQQTGTYALPLFSLIFFSRRDAERMDEQTAVNEEEKCPPTSFLAEQRQDRE
jgi:hypothetical protein